MAIPDGTGCCGKSVFGLSCVRVPNMIIMLAMPFDVGKQFVTASRLFPRSCNVYFSVAFAVSLVMCFVYLISGPSRNYFLVLFSKWYWVTVHDEFYFWRQYLALSNFCCERNVGWGFN